MFFGVKLKKLLQTNKIDEKSILPSPKVHPCPPASCKLHLLTEQQPDTLVFLSSNKNCQPFKFESPDHAYGRKSGRARCPQPSCSENIDPISELKKPPCCSALPISQAKAPADHKLQEHSTVSLLQETKKNGPNRERNDHVGKNSAPTEHTGAAKVVEQRSTPVLCVSSECKVQDPRALLVSSSQNHHPVLLTIRNKWKNLASGELSLTKTSSAARKMDHEDLVAELSSIEKMSNQERLKLAHKRRMLQLRKWSHYEKECNSKKGKTSGGRMGARKSHHVKSSRGVKFRNSIMLLEAAGRGDVHEGKKFTIFFYSVWNSQTNVIWCVVW